MWPACEKKNTTARDKKFNEKMAGYASNKRVKMFICSPLLAGRHNHQLDGIGLPSSFSLMGHLPSL